MHTFCQAFWYGGGMLNPLDFPALAFDRLWHVGSMNPADKNDWSYEGQGLSVSVHPEDWTAIARLGGSPTWELARAGGALLHFHALTSAQRDQIDAWGVEQGFVEPVTRWRVSWYDEDLDDTVSMLCETKHEALAEAEFREDEDGAEPTPTRVQVLAATATFPDHTVQPGTTAIREPLAALWVSTHRPDLDGVWFEEEYDPLNLSCPRGVIAKDRLDRWTATKVARTA